MYEAIKQALLERDKMLAKMEAEMLIVEKALKQFDDELQELVND
jgi:hypothetical protein